MNPQNPDLIAAIATPPGRGGVGVIRLSGKDLLPLAETLCGKRPAPRAATIVAARDGTIGKWPYSKLHSASPGLQSKMLQIFFRLAAERLKQSDERYLRLYRQYAQSDDSGA